MRARTPVATFFLVLLIGCKSTPNNAAGAAAPAPTQAAGPAELVERYLDDHLRDNPGLGRGLGLHEYDGKVSPVGPEAVAARTARARAQIAAVDALELSSLPDPLRLDLELTRLSAAQVLFQLEDLKLASKILYYRSLFDVSGYLVRDYAPLPRRVSALLDHLEQEQAQVPVILASLNPRQVRTQLETAQKSFGGLKEYFEGDVKIMTQPARDADPALEARYQKVIGQTFQAIAAIEAWMKAHEKETSDDYALGEANFLKMLEVNEGLKITLPELEQMAADNFKKNHDAYIAVAKRIDPKKTTEQVTSLVMSQRLGSTEVLPTARRQLDELRGFIEAKAILSIGAEDKASVEVTPPFMRWNSAFLDQAGPFEQASGSFYYISPPDPSWPKDMQDAYLPYEGDLLSTSIHEVYPGHFVQGLQIRRAPTRAMKMLDSYAFVEGWAHYVEEMMFEQGLSDEPKRRLGQLSNALLRNCRFTAAIGMHTHGMTVEQAKKLFEKDCFVDPGNALQQAYRGTFDPGFLSYTLGKLQIIALREKYFAKHGKDLRAFHDWLLSYGSSPVTLIGQRL